MFLVSDTLASRQQDIKSFSGRQATIGALLATMDFEWTVRRAILALGYQSSKVIREQVLRNCHGLRAYSDAWKQQVMPEHRKSLSAIVPDWRLVSTKAYPLRHELVHGVRGSSGEAYANECRDALLSGSAAIVGFAKEKGVDLYCRLPVRRNDRNIQT